jgi:putative Mg2+ transporter-C (MgtC) family protein
MPPHLIASLDQVIQSWTASLSPPWEQLLRLLVAAVAGGLIGLEREVRGRRAGFRTNLLVCVGSALAMIVSMEFGHYPWPTPQHAQININVDPARIAYSVMGGIGFLGAGTILRSGGAIYGLTTAAALWCVAALGLAAGFGMYSLTILATLLILFVLWLLDYLENLLPKSQHRTVVVRRRWEQGCVDATIARFKQAKVSVIDIDVKRSPDLASADISLQVEFIDRERYRALMLELESDQDVLLLESRTN